MKELSIEEKARCYDEAIDKIADAVEAGTIEQGFEEWLFPELKESEDEKIKNFLIDFIKVCSWTEKKDQGWPLREECVAWLEKQGEQKPCMIQWKGDNLKEVIDFTGKDGNFDKWFKSFEEYEQYVQEHDGIFKLFNADGSHYEVPVGAWIVKTPDGYNVASKAIFKQNHAWSEEDENAIKVLKNIIKKSEIIDSLIYTDLLKEKLYDWLKSIKGRVQSKSKPAWDEQDEKIYSRIYDLIHAAAFENYDVDEDGKECGEYAKITDWFKSLKYKVQLKQEWSEDDEKTIHLACEFIRHHSRKGDSISGIDCTELVKMLESLKDRYTWKPSDEQILALRWVLNHIPYDSHKEEISGLLDQIKDL